jgi:uncharacterized protein DUF2017
LRSLPSQLRELLAADDPSVGRLFPPAYEDDPERQSEYDELVRGDLTAQRLRALDVLEETLDAERLDEEQLTAWLGALNDLRLVLGTKLDMTDDMNPDDISDADEQAPIYALYYYLGWLQEQVVEELAYGLDPKGRE